MQCGGKVRKALKNISASKSFFDLPQSTANIYKEIQAFLQSSTRKIM